MEWTVVSFAEMVLRFGKNGEGDGFFIILSFSKNKN
jgi:hypothetical protein